MRREYVTEVCAVEDVFECWEDADPDWWAVFGGYELSGVEEDEPADYGEEGEEELSGYWYC